VKEGKITIWLVLIAILFFVVIAEIVYLVTFNKPPNTSEAYNELEFTVIHRPHITYLVDTKYLLCFATRKPQYQDLVQIECPEKMWKEVEYKLHGKQK
jgi:hypothetical protein